MVSWIPVFFKRSVNVVPLWVQGAPSGWPVCPVDASSSFFLLTQHGVPSSSCFFVPQPPSNQPSLSGVPILLSPEWYLEPKVWVVSALSAPGLLLTPGPLRGGSRLVSQSRLTLCDPMDCSPPGSSVHGISQTRTLEWVAISFFSRGSSRTRDRTHISCAGKRIPYH